MESLLSYGLLTNLADICEANDIDKTESLRDDRFEASPLLCSFSTYTYLA